MNSGRWVRGILFMVVGLALAACGTQGPETLAVTVTDGGITGLPTELSAGIFEFTVTNEGSAPMDVDLIESGGNSAEQFSADFAAVLAGAPIPDYMQQVVGFGSIEPGSSIVTTLTLHSAEYFAVDSAAETPRVLGTVVVNGDGGSAKDLPGGATIRAREYGFAIDGITSGTEQVTFINDGPLQVHHAVIMPFPKGVSEDEAMASLQVLITLGEGDVPPEGIPMPDDAATMASGVFSADAGGTFATTFEAGRTYGILCFVGDRQGGPPHAIAHQMLDAFTVTE